ncbi:Leucine-rich repeat, typical subtype [Corchorus capsularis]|uniref:Leucine-rich repeat, typical subtype n=1 Tax=Corchorus capsularis TaxID=210143 RepID=A0A1R3HKW1_COCAP|nr:Leucine-rich repeat, typical subtype [Corchorus capsularis]
MRGRQNKDRSNRRVEGHAVPQPQYYPAAPHPNFFFDPGFQIFDGHIPPFHPYQQISNEYVFQNAYVPPNPNTPARRKQPKPQAAPSSSQTTTIPNETPKEEVPEVREKAEQAVKEAWQTILASGRNVTTFDVSQKALATLQADSWSALGFDMKGIPSIQKLLNIEARVNVFIQCFILVRRITTVYELEMAICENEGVSTFEKLEIGPLLRHPLALRSFALNPDAKEVLKITSDDIIAHLQEYMEGHETQDIFLNEFLDFVAEKQAVASRENLGIHIRNLTMHVNFIMKAKGERNSKVNEGQKELKLKERYINMKQQVESFISVHKDFCGKHTKFDSSSSEEEDGNDSANEEAKNENHESNNSKLGSQISNSSDRVNSCPYPSATEELTRLGLTDGTDKPSSVTGKRKRTRAGRKRWERKRRSLTRALFSGSLTPVSDRPSKLSRGDGLMKHVPTDNGANLVRDVTLPDNAIKTFVTTWKEACREHDVAEIREEGREICLQPETPSPSSCLVALRRKSPVSGVATCCCSCSAKNALLLQANRADKGANEVNVLFISIYRITKCCCSGHRRLNFVMKHSPQASKAYISQSSQLTSVRKGMWDSIYDTIQAVRQFKSTDTADNYSEYESIDVEPSEKDASILTETQGVTLEDVIKKIIAYFELNHGIHGVRSLKEQKLLLLRKLFNCESWLAEQFCVNDFKSLGHGDFLVFLERHASLLPSELQQFVAAGLCNKSPLEVCITQHLLTVLMSQASYNLQDNNILTKETISALFMKQFPMLSFKVVENGSMEDFLEVVEKSKNDVSSNCVVFSSSLLEMCHNGNSLAYDKNHSSEAKCVENVMIVKSVASKDAMAVLLRAPMLSNLISWSHWDVLFAPSLGSLIEWLLNEANAKELLCLVTKDGAVIRIDHSATMDSFLEAALKGSAFETALKLLSLCSICGGIKHLPLALLKHHAVMALEVLLKNHVENMELDDDQNSILNGKAFLRPKLLEDVSVGSLGSELRLNLVKMNKAASRASRFFLDCLWYLPSEFRGCAADILIHGMRPVIKDCPSAILSECNELRHRVMLHEVGLSLGIVEWIQDYHAFCSVDTSNIFLSSEGLAMKTGISDLKTRPNNTQNAMDELSNAGKEIIVPDRTDKQSKVCPMIDRAEVSAESLGTENRRPSVDDPTDAALLIESIRRDEFGLDPHLSDNESSMLKKQHARLGRALHCLSQELYSQDSHFLLELVQNADDNVYAENVEPTLIFILQERGVIVLNNEQGFSAQNIRALCDIGSSTKKGYAGYIGKKGIGFKSVFRVTDAPEIHSNGFHVKFDISDGQIGFVLPTQVPPCTVDSFKMLVSGEDNHLDNNSWKTCIILPFRSVTSKGNDMNCAVSMFSDLHPSLLLFLHKLQCIVFRNMLNNSFIVMRKEIVGNGIVKVSSGIENMTWFVASKKLQADKIHRDVQITEISIAFTLQESDSGYYRPFLDQQPVFAFLPLRTYGLKFILQGDFVLPSSREEVDVDSPWNQWLLLEYPSLFVSAEMSFCSLPCFQDNPGKAVSIYMSFVPLVGEVHGFFSCLPRMIISKLRVSNCLILEGEKNHWVPPCKVLRGWTESACKLLPEALLYEHLCLGYLDKDIVLSDALARALGILDYGPKVLVQIMSSLCQRENGIKSMGLAWLSSWLNEFYTISSGHASINYDIETDLVSNLKKIPLVPLSDGTFGSVDEGTIWLHSDAINTGFERDLGFEAFPTLYAKLRFVNPSLFSASAFSVSHIGNITSALHTIGVQQLSAHEIIKVHILPELSHKKIKAGDENLMIDYLCFVMIHLQSSCLSCHVERDHIMSELRNKAFILTNYGFKRPAEVAVHFSKKFDNPVNIKRLINDGDLEWHEVDVTYLKHPSFRLLSSGLKKWREFFLEIGVTDFVQVVQLDKSLADMSSTVLQSLLSDLDLLSPGSAVKDWESHELVQLLSLLSTGGNRDGCKYLLEVLDRHWDYYSEKATACCNIKSGGDSRPFRSSFLSNICDTQWVVSSMDDKLHYPKELFHDCDAVRSVLGACAPYAVPKVRSGKLVDDIGFKTQVTFDDVLEVLKSWRSNASFKASIAQMSRLYTFIWNEIHNARQKSAEEIHAMPIFVPYKSASRPNDVVPGMFSSSKELYWHDSTGTLDQIMHDHFQSGSSFENQRHFIRSLSNVYPGLHDFFVNECKVPEKPSFCGYLDILVQLSKHSLPSKAAKAVFQVFREWADGLKSGFLSSEDIYHIKDCLTKSDYTVLPTVLDKWVSLHSSFGLVCWCDDESLGRRFRSKDNIDFLYFGALNDNEKELLRTQVSSLIRTLGIPVLSEVVTREAIYCDQVGGSFEASMLNWALPFAQRYLYCVHPDIYVQLKQSGFDKIKKLEIVVVRKLHYRNVIKSHGIMSKKQYECTSLLQDNILYTTRKSDSHALYMEFSRLLFGGTPDLHLSNFLHMVTTMAKSGSNEEQTEFFILNSQKVAKLPDEEPAWSLSFAPCEVENNELLETSSALTVGNEKSTLDSNKIPEKRWPPVDWKKEGRRSKRQKPNLQPTDGSKKSSCHGTEDIDSDTSSGFPSEMDVNMATTSKYPNFPDSESMLQQGNTCDPADCSGRIVIDPSVDSSLLSDSRQVLSFQSSLRNQLEFIPPVTPGFASPVTPGFVPPVTPGFVPPEYCPREQPLTGNPIGAEAKLTGKLGELAAFKFFSGRFGESVKWVNRDNETGLPYDLVIEGKDGHIEEYIEVKTTRFGRKDWFKISTREWQFGSVKGGSFSIAHVFLLSDKDAVVSVYKDPIKLCQQGKLHLVIMLPRQPQWSDACREDERIALLNLKPFFNDYGDLNEWVEGKGWDCCEWTRVECNSTTNRVISLSLNYTRVPYWGDQHFYLDLSLFLPLLELKALYLRGNAIAGFVEIHHHYQGFGNAIAGFVEIHHHHQGFANPPFPTLERLDLSDNNLNDIDSSILSSLTALSSLNYLDLSGNQFTGSGRTDGNGTHLRFTNLEELDLSNNLFRNNTFAFLSGLSSLKSLVLSYNQLRGLINITGLNNLIKLKKLDLSWNRIETLGSLKDSGRQLKLTHLEELYLSENLLNNSVFALLGGLSNLKSLLLSSNQLSGSIDMKDLTTFPHLEELDMSYNKLNEFQFVADKGNRSLRKLKVVNLDGVIANGGLTTLQEIIKGFSSVKTLYLRWNYFNSTVESTQELNMSWSNVEQMFLDDSHLDPNILQRIGGLTSLKSLSLSYSRLIGTLPHHGWCDLRKLEELYVDGNALEGNLPSCLGNLTSLRVLDISSNQFTGDLTPLSYLRSLRFLFLSRNLFQVPLSFILTNLTDLKIFFCDENKLVKEPIFHTPIPKSQLIAISLSKCTSDDHQQVTKEFLYFQHELRYIDLSFTNLKGNVPFWLLENNTKLEALLLMGNSFTGHIPSCLGNLTFESDYHKSYLVDSFYVASSMVDESEYIGRDRVSRKYPVRYMEEKVEFTTKSGSYSYKGNILDYMSGIDLSCNNLTGLIPLQLGNLSEIHSLNLSHNNLTGVIPSSFSNLKQIESMDLSYNNLDGEIPNQLVELNSLEVFSVAHNNLSGSTPERKAQFGTFDENSYEGNPLLCGPPLNNSCSKSDSPPTASDHEDGEGSLLDMYFFCVSFLVAYVAVLLVIVVVLYINPYWRRLWFNFIEDCIDTCRYSKVGRFIVYHISRRFA